MIVVDDNLLSRFWMKVRKGGAEDCWGWLAARAGRMGYGYITVRYEDGKLRTASAHRVVWQMSFGAIPAGLCVLHHCDNPECVNPSHLFLGTHKDNSQDARGKGRLMNGENNGQSKLQERDVCLIRERVRETVPQAAIARDFGVSEATVSLIVGRKRWGWLECR